MAAVHQESSPVALLVVLGLHAALLAFLLHHHPRVDAARMDVMLVSLITPPQPLRVEALPEPPRPPVQPKKIQRAVTPPPIEAPSPSAISAPPTPPAPEPAPIVASAHPASAPTPPEPVALPRFDAAYLQNPAPAYPPVSRRMGEHGRVLLRVLVRADGAPESVVLSQSSGSPRLDEAALDAVRKWRFVPARQGSTPISAAVIVPIVFSLEG
jgi:periplasmic protein TonB